MRCFWGSMSESSLLVADPVLVHGPGADIVLIVLLCAVFAMVAFSENRWFAGMGVVAVVVVGMGAVFSWASLTDHPLAYRAGNVPDDKTNLGELYYVWQLKAGERISTTFEVEVPAAQHLAESLSLDFGCDDAARVDWQIHVGDDLVDSGSLRNGREHDLTDVAIPSENGSVEVKMTATRGDSATCATDLNWTNPGLEGPGNGNFRFVFPGLPDES